MPCCLLKMALLAGEPTGAPPAQPRGSLYGYFDAVLLVSVCVPGEDLDWFLYKPWERSLHADLWCQ